MRANARRGYSFIELGILLLLVGLLGSLGVSFGLGMASKAKVRNANSDLTAFATEIKDAMYVCGAITTEELSSESARYDYFEALDSECPRLQIDSASITYINHSTGGMGSAFYFGSEYDGVVFNLIGREDPWATDYRVYYLVSVMDGSCRLLFASAGGDSEFSNAAAVGYVGYDLKYDDIEDDLVQTISVGG